MPFGAVGFVAVGDAAGVAGCAQVGPAAGVRVGEHAVGFGAECLGEEMAEAFVFPVVGEDGGVAVEEPPERVHGFRPNWT
jgi:hypothetical protein